LPADCLGRRHWHCGRIIEAEPSREVERHQIVVTQVLGRAQQTSGVGFLPDTIAGDFDQVIAAQQLGSAELGGGEVEPFDLSNDVEDAVGLALGDAGAIGAMAPLVPAPARVLVVVLGIGAGNVRVAIAPGNAESVEDVALAPADGGLNRRSGDIAHRIRCRTRGGHGSACGADKCCAGGRKY
jgi:hypothetical protein